MKSLSGTNNVNRLVILVVGPDLEKLLAAPVLQSGRGVDEANAIFETLRQWGLCEKVKSMCFDTTATNSGPNKGACVKLQEMLGRQLYNFACRHHILELIIAAVYDALFGSSVGPKIQLFHRFQAAWNSIDRDNYTCGMEDPEMNDFLGKIKTDMVEFYTHS